MNLDQHDEVSVVQLMRAICSRSPREIPEDTLADVAKQIWYGELNLAALLKELLAQPDMADEQRRRLLYVIDRLICYPCILRSKAIQLRTVLKEWAALKPTQPTANAIELAGRHMLDKKALEWGLEEDITPQMKSVLQYQTRHYAASVARMTGYSEP